MPRGRRVAERGAGVVVLDDEAVVAALAQRVAVGAVLGHADPVAPAAAVDHDVGGRRRWRGGRARTRAQAVRRARIDIPQQGGSRRVAVPSCAPIAVDRRPHFDAVRLALVVGRVSRSRWWPSPAWCGGRRARIRPSCLRAGASSPPCSARSPSTPWPRWCAPSAGSGCWWTRARTPSRADTYALTCVGYAGQQRAPGAGRRRDPHGPDGAARGRVEAHGDRHAAGRAAARRRGAARALRRGRLGAARRGRRRQAGDRGARARGRRGGRRRRLPRRPPQRAADRVPGADRVVHARAAPRPPRAAAARA